MYPAQDQWTTAQVPAECADIAFGGAFTLVLLLALPLAILMSWGTVLWYRKTIARVMRQVSSDAASEPHPTTQDTAHRAPSPLQFRYYDDQTTGGSNPAIAAVSQRVRRVATAYVLAGLVHALIVSALTLFLSNTEFLPVRFSTLVLLYVWPVVPTLIVTSVGDPRVKWSSLIGYFLLVFALEAFLINSGIMQGSGYGALLGTWLVWMGPPSLLLLILSNRAWRSVGLLAYLLAIAWVAGWLFSTQALGCLALSLNDVSLWVTYRWPLLLGATALTGGLAWWVLKRIARRYREKQISDQSLTLSSWWLLITLVETIIQFDDTGGASASFILAFFAFQWVSRRLLQSPDSQAPRSLLLLRVFGHRTRSRKLLDQLGQRWRFLGPINLIGAPDVATTNLEPHELMMFWGGKSRSLFVPSESALNRKVATLDRAPDPDGRFRTNEFFCYDNTWRSTVKALAEKSDAVLMDLRGFGPDNRGCEFELRLLLNDIPLDGIILLVDHDTDTGMIQSLLSEIWTQLPETSPNRMQPEPRVKLFRASGPLHSVRSLIYLLTPANDNAAAIQ